MDALARFLDSLPLRISLEDLDYLEKVLISFLNILIVSAAISLLIVLVFQQTLAPKRFILHAVVDPAKHEGTGEVIRTCLLDELRTARKEAKTLTELDGANANVPQALLSLPEKYKWIEPLFNRLIAPRHFIIAATPLRPDCDQVGLHVQISNSTGTVLEARQFTEPSSSTSPQSESDNDRNCTYRSLSITAGSWLAFMLIKHSLPRAHAHEPVILFGTDSWESYAMMRHGIRSNGSLAEKRRWHDAALWEDHKNIRALLELAKIDSLDFDPETSLKHGIRHIELAHDLLAEDWRGLSRWLRLQYRGARVDPRWYQATYALAVHCVNRYCALSNEADFSKYALEDLDRSLRLAAELTRTVGATQLTLASRWRKYAIKPSHRDEIRELLDREALDLATVLILPLSCEERRQEDAKGETQLVVRIYHSYGDIKPDWIPTDIWDFFASTYTSDMAPRHMPMTPVFTKDIIKIQDYYASKDLPGAHESLLLLPWKLRYQRACALVQVGKTKEAVELLLKIFDHAASIPPLVPGKQSGSEVATWASNDPMLNPLLQMLEETRNSPRMELERNDSMVRLAQLIPSTTNKVRN